MDRLFAVYDMFYNLHVTHDRTRDSNINIHTNETIAIVKTLADANLLSVTWSKELGA